MTNEPDMFVDATAFNKGLAQALADFRETHHASTLDALLRALTYARARAPFRTGALRESITLNEGELPPAEGGGKAQRYFDFGTRLFYAIWTEFGTVKEKPRAFMRPALLYLRRLR